MLPIEKQKFESYQIKMSIHFKHIIYLNFNPEPDLQQAV